MTTKAVISLMGVGLATLIFSASAQAGVAECATLPGYDAFTKALKDAVKPSGGQIGRAHV